MKFRLLIMLLCTVFAHTAWAEIPANNSSSLQQQIQQLTELVTQLDATVQGQQQRITALEQTNQTLQSQVGGPALTQVISASSSPGRIAQGLQVFNPEIGILADVVGRLSQSSEDAEGNDKLSVRELELIISHDIDPYSRFDSTITFSDFEDPVIEEAYITHWGLPWEVKARLGRMRPKIGKASAVHRDQLDTVDEPLVIQKYLGLEGLFRTGVELSGFLPLPWESVTHELIGGVMEGGIGEGGTLFGSTRRRPSFYARLRNFWDISDASNLELGSTYLTGSKDEDGRFEVNALGLDATLTHYVTPNNKLKWQTEAYLQDRDETDAGLQENPWGFYSLIDYRLSPRLGIGSRFDYVQPVDNAATSPRDADTAWSTYLTLHQSEFARWRVQYQHAELAGGGNDNLVFLQGSFAIGVHKHQLQ